MSELHRRRFLAVLAATIVGGVGVARFAWADTGPPGAPHDEGVVPDPKAAQAPLPSTPPIVRVPLPGGGVLDTLPGEGRLLALTLDDGVNTDVVRAYTQFAGDTGMRLTYFVNGTYPSWTDHRDLLAPLVSAGQIQLGNHTWSHPDLTTLSEADVAQQITHNDQFLRNTYGVDPRPYLRPPYGKHNPTVRNVAGGLGYTATTLWNGSLSDSTVVTEDYIRQMVDKYFTPQSLVIGHLNHLPVTHVYGHLVDVIRARTLRSVTLNDVFLSPR